MAEAGSESTSYVNECSDAEREAILARMPQKPPFLFVDKILELSQKHIVAQYRFKEDEYFYKGHFPGDPITPGVIMIEAMAQVGLVALGIYVVSKENPEWEVRALFVDCQNEFFKIVRPGELVTIRAERLQWRRLKMQSKIEMKNEQGELVATGLISGLGVRLN